MIKMKRKSVILLPLFFILLLMVACDTGKINEYDETLRSGTTTEKLMAIRALEVLGSGKVVLPLMGALEDDERDVRADAALALGRLKATKAFDAIVDLLGDDDHVVRFGAVMGLEALGDPRAIESLKALLDDDDDTLRKAVEEAIEKLEK